MSQSGEVAAPLFMLLESRLLALVGWLLCASACQRSDVRPAVDAGTEKECDRPELDPPEQRTPCCGCLCADERWSCSEDTCTDEYGRVLELAPEAGFFELARLPAHASHGASPSARMWYSFFPADEDPHEKPLFLFMQGGPGASGLPLWGGNTGPKTLDPRVSAEAGEIPANPHAWSRFGNLLYIDTAVAGLSYQLAESGEAASCRAPFDGDHDAAQYLTVLLRFLERHPAIEAAPVVFVAESYGGVRATLMLQQLLHPDTLRDDAGAYLHVELADEIDSHARRVAWHRCQGSEPSADTTARQFQAQILIQAVALGEVQRDFGTTWASQECVRSGIPGTGAIEHSVLEAMLPRIGNAKTLSAFVGVDVTTIRWLHASERSMACPRHTMNEGDDALPSLAESFGALAATDAFYLRVASLAHGVSPRSRFGEAVSVPGTVASDRPLSELFLDNVLHVATFATNARCDEILDMHHFAHQLPGVPGVRAATLLATDDLQVTEITLLLAGDLQRTIRFPTYAESGHMVAIHDPATLVRNVEDWLRERTTVFEEPSSGTE